MAGYDLKKITRIGYIFSKKISSALSWRKSFLLLCFSLFLTSFFAGCKDEEEVGLNLLPPNDQLYTDFNDTSTVLTQTLLEDSLRTDELSLQLIGSDRSPVFGLSVASVYAHVNLAGTPTFGDSAVADSLILTLAYSGYYGDTIAQQTLNIYKLTDDMYIDSSYFSSRNFGYASTPIASLTFAPKPNTIDTLTVSPRLRITLDRSQADSILLMDPSDYASNAAWLAKFKGLYFQAQPVSGPGAISYFSFFNSILSLYFHNGIVDTLNSVYNFSLAGARLNSFSHDYTGSTVGNQISNPLPDDSLNFVQSLAGVKTKITFPFLKHFLDSGSILINRAELKITAEPAVIPYSLPGKMLLVTKNESGETIFPIDYFESAGYYGGDLNATSDGYTFNIARHLQRYLNGTVTNVEFYLIVSGSGVEANRAIIKSGSNQNAGMKLSLFYTKLN